MIFEEMNLNEDINYQVELALSEFTSRFKGAFEKQQSMRHLMIDTRFYDADLAMEAARKIKDALTDGCASSDIYRNVSVDDAHYYTDERQ